MAEVEVWMKVCFIYAMLLPSLNSAKGTLVEPQRGHHRKLWNLDPKRGAIYHFLHQVGTYHFAKPGFEIAARYVLMHLARLKYRLLAYNTFAFYFAWRKAGIVNVPMPAQQLNGEVALILDGDAIGKNIVILAGAGVGGLVLGLHRNLYTLCDLSNHPLQKYHFFLFYNRPLQGSQIFDMPSEVKIENSWKEKLNGEFEKPYFQQLTEFVKQEYQTHIVYPPGKEIFRAFDYCPFRDVKVVIIGQDPYHGPGQANGLCFSVRPGQRMPPSLVNIFKELLADLGKPLPPSGELERWAQQGVLLLNATLTVRASSPGSHQNKGWETFTDEVIRMLSLEKENLVFILWGAYAQKKGEVIDRQKHYVIMSPHPSPFSADRGFFGSKPFSKANDYLRSKGIPEIDW